MQYAQKTGLRYGLELGTAAVLFVAAMAIREPLANGAGSASPLVLALPVVPLWLMFVAIWRHYLRVDEFQRLQFLKVTALAAGIGLFALASLPFLGGFGVPREAGDVLWLVIPVGWVVSLAVVNLNRAR